MCSLQFICRFILPDLSSLVSDSGIGNADKIRASMYKEDFADLQGAHWFLGDRGGSGDPSPTSFLEVAVMGPFLSERGSWLC